ncbi:hypothetical protein E2C01_002961 [Portunus trituberculatus]|uniref:Uncharacterized protein n=1 Tax=Portunus trituberculatus TaxID=210409 RepID=A0A5B7CL38_PORTR|nr:hypothetical protein [Portunus trituberculatus]
MEGQDRASIITSHSHPSLRKALNTHQRFSQTHTQIPSSAQSRQLHFTLINTNGERLQRTHPLLLSLQAPLDSSPSPSPLLSLT